MAAADGDAKRRRHKCAAAVQEAKVMKMQTSTALEKIGFSPGEIRVYEALLELGSCSTGALIKKSGVSGSKVYEVLDRLKAKGVVTEVTKDGVKRFEAANPARILDYLDEKRQTIEEEKLLVQQSLPQLLLKWNSAKKGEVKIFTGFEGLKTANEDIIMTLRRGEEWLSMGLSEQPESWERHFNKRQEFRSKKGIIQKHLLNLKYKSLFEKRKKLPHTEFRFLPKELEMPTSTEVYRDKVIIMIMTPESPFAIMIESKEVADSFRKYFYVMWESAKR